MWARHLLKILKAVDLLGGPHGATVAELTEKLGVDRRTVYRLRETLEEMNFPIYEDSSAPDGRKRWKLEGGYLKKLPNITTPDLSLTLSEIIALYCIRGNMRLYRGTEIEHKINAAFAKLDAFVPDGLTERLNSIKTLFIPSKNFAKDYSGKEEIIETLIDAMLRKTTCLVTYHSFYDDRTKEYEICPLHFFERDGGLYLFFQAKKYSDIRTLAVERVQRLEKTDETFAYPAEFDPESLLESSFSLAYDDPVEARIWFPASQAKYIRERKWGREQTIAENADGSIVLEVKTSGRWEVKRWVLSFGKEAELLEPADLREDVAHELLSAAKKYMGRLSVDNAQ